MDRRQTIGLIGSVILFVGVFMPVLNVPIMGNLNYFQNGEGDGIIIILLAVISLVLTLSKNYQWLWLTGLGSFGVLAFTFINFQVRMSELKSQMNVELKGNPFRGLADMAMQSVVAAAAIKENTKKGAPRELTFPEQLSEKVIAEVAEEIRTALATNLLSLVLYGSHARGEAHARSDVNLLILVRESDPSQLVGLLRALSPLARKGVVAPVIMSEEEFRASQDTFALEFLDMAAQRRILAGKDPFEQFEPRWDGLRMQMERELRVKMLQLYRQWYVSEEKPETLKILLRGSLSSFLTLLRGIVALEKKQIVTIPQVKLIEEIAGERGLDATLWPRFQQVAHGDLKLSADEIRILFRSYLAEIKTLTAYVDKLKV
jgi:predicted nucleotidyltransferase